MKILVLNGSPRKGNTKQALMQVCSHISDKHEVEMLDLYDFQFSPYCENKKADDSMKVIEKILKADVLVFGTPVYYMGMSAQMKMLIDNFILVNEQLMEKKRKVYAVACGGDGLDNIQYHFIGEHIKAIATYLKWEFVQFIPIAAYEADDVLAQPETMNRLAEMGKSI